MFGDSRFICPPLKAGPQYPSEIPQEVRESTGLQVQVGRAGTGQEAEEARAGERCGTERGFLSLLLLYFKDRRDLSMY